MMLGSGSEPQFLVSPETPRLENQYTENHSTLMTVTVLTFSTVFSTLHQIFTILDKIGFGLDDFAQLSANISVPSNLKVGQVKL